jgi:hypothetical protein
VARIAYAKEKCRKFLDEGGEYPVIRYPVVEVEVHIRLDVEEATLIRNNRKGDRRLATLLGPALRWEFNAEEDLYPPSVTAHHSVESNPHRVRNVRLIAERTLSALEKVLRNLAPC